MRGYQLTFFTEQNRNHGHQPSVARGLRRERRG
jgi:hypothetical protein